MHSPEARCIWCHLSVEFGHWNATGRHLRAEQGCRIHDRGRADLRDRQEHRADGTSDSTNRVQLAQQKHSEVTDIWSETDHQTEVARFQLLLHFSEDVRVQSLSEPDDVRPQQAVTTLLVTPVAETPHMSRWIWPWPQNNVCDVCDNDAENIENCIVNLKSGSVCSATWTQARDARLHLTLWAQIFHLQSCSESLFSSILSEKDTHTHSSSPQPARIKV